MEAGGSALCSHLTVRSLVVERYIMLVSQSAEAVDLSGVNIRCVLVASVMRSTERCLSANEALTQLGTELRHHSRSQRLSPSMTRYAEFIN